MTTHLPEEEFEKNYQYLRESRYFQNISEEALRKILVLTRFRRYAGGEVIIQQGNQNQEVYFIASGTVSVYVDERFIYNLNRKGDIFGEMSVLTRQVSSAKILAKTDVELITISLEGWQQLHEEPIHEIHHVFYKWFAQILADKLFLTSQKAKLYEDLSRELQNQKQELEQQNFTLIAINRKLEDLYSTKELLLKRLSTLPHTHLRQLNIIHEALLDQIPAELRETLKQAIYEAIHVDAVLRSASSLYTWEQSIRSKRVLLAEPNKKQQVIAKMALRGSGVEIDIANTLEEGAQLIATQRYDMLCVDVSLVELLVAARLRNPNLPIVLMTSTDIQEYLPVLRQYPIHNIVSRHAEDRPFTLKNILTTVSKLLSGDIFGLEKYLTWGVDVQQRPVVDSASRFGLVTQMQEYFRALGIRNSFIDKASFVAEELLMNAIYDAPVDAMGRSLYNHLPRTQPVILSPREQAMLRYACDGLLLAVSVEDPFGVLTRQTILDYLERAHRPGGLTMQQSKGGSGRGLFYIMETADAIVINVQAGTKTEVITIFNIEKPKSDQTTSLHFFSA